MADTKRKEIYDFIKRFVEANGYGPSVREICAAVKLNSTATVHYHLRGLAEQRPRGLRHVLDSQCACDKYLRAREVLLQVVVQLACDALAFRDDHLEFAALPPRPRPCRGESDDGDGQNAYEHDCGGLKHVDRSRRKNADVRRAGDFDLRADRDAVAVEHIEHDTSDLHSAARFESELRNVAVHARGVDLLLWEENSEIGSDVAVLVRLRVDASESAGEPDAPQVQIPTP